jgi:glucose-6-phosphate 1-dehydrogenase
MIRRIVILGAAGDLAFRYLLPALARLHEAGRLPDSFTIVALARDDWDTAIYRSRAAERLERHAAGVARSSREALTAMLQYHRADAGDRARVAAALGPSREPLVAYLALPPAVFAPAIETLSAIGLLEGSRIAVEKPFGEDLASARALNRMLHETFPEEAVFRVDHFLEMQTVQNILGLRFANRVFEPLWNRDHVERIELFWEETLALEGRASYYDSAGALRDVIQNHLLQLFCLIGMEAPVTLGERDLRDRKVDVLRAVRRLSREEVERGTVRARYGPGRIGERDVPAYADESGVDPDRQTETLAQITLRIDNWRWAGVPFVLRTGKALARERFEVAVHLKPVPHLSFGETTELRPNVLRLQFNPDRIALAVNINGPGDPFDLERTELRAELAPHDLPEYGRLLLDILEGNPTFSVRADEAEESWRIVEPILEAWAQGRVPLLEYPAGSEGPQGPAPPRNGTDGEQGVTVSPRVTPPQPEG